ncbi:Uncharacterised protein g10688 [Pycnogonum litorale]
MKTLFAVLAVFALIAVALAGSHSYGGYHRGGHSGYQPYNRRYVGSGYGRGYNTGHGYGNNKGHGYGNYGYNKGHGHDSYGYDKGHGYDSYGYNKGRGSYYH